MPTWTWIVLAALVVLWLWSGQRRRNRTAKYQSLMAYADNWFEQRNFDVSSLIYTGYEGANLVAYPGAFTIVGVGKIPHRNLSMGFVVDLAADGSVLRGELILDGVATYHSYEAGQSKMRGQLLFDRMVQRSRRTVNAA